MKLKLKYSNQNWISHGGMYFLMWAFPDRNFQVGSFYLCGNFVERFINKVPRIIVDFRTKNPKRKGFVKISNISFRTDNQITSSIFQGLVSERVHHAWEQVGSPSTVWMRISSDEK